MLLYYKTQHVIFIILIKGAKKMPLNIKSDGMRNL